jgi:flagellar biosynthesis protein FlhB
MREIPIQYQIACVVLTALFIWSFSVAREPRGWRRLFQSMFSKSETFSVNRNKVIDESLKKYGIVVAMVILVADVTCFVVGVTHPYRERAKALSKEQRDNLNEINRIQGNNPEAARRSALP